MSAAPAVAESIPKSDRTAAENQPFSAEMLPNVRITAARPLGYSAGMKKWLIPATLLAFSWGCSSPEAPLPGPPEWNRKVAKPADSDAEAQRASCGFQAGAL